KWPSRRNKSVNTEASISTQTTPITPFTFNNAQNPTPANVIPPISTQKVTQVNDETVNNTQDVASSTRVNNTQTDKMVDNTQDIMQSVPVASKTLVKPSPRTTTQLNLLSPSETDYQTIHTKFMSHLPAATVKAIFSLEMPDYIVKRHELMKKQIPVPRQTFHGTKHQCDPNRYIVSKGDAKPCGVTNCGLCGIIQDGNRCDKSNHSVWSAIHANTSLYYTLPGPIRAMFVLDILTNLPENNATPHVTQDA
ncbi:13756_t:CDS:2, partial [Ambispora leptoticha]